MKKLRLTHKTPHFVIETDENAIETILSLLVRKFSRDVVIQSKDVEAVIKMQQAGKLNGVNILYSAGFKNNKRIHRGLIESYRHALQNAFSLEIVESEEPTKVVVESKKVEVTGNFDVIEKEEKKVTKKKVTKKKVTKKKVTKKG